MRQLTCIPGGWRLGARLPCASQLRQRETGSPSVSNCKEPSRALCRLGEEQAQQADQSGKPGNGGLWQQPRRHQASCCRWWENDFCFFHLVKVFFFSSDQYGGGRRRDWRRAARLHGADGRAGGRDYPSHRGNHREKGEFCRPGQAYATDLSLCLRPAPFFRFLPFCPFSFFISLGGCVSQGGDARLQGRRVPLRMVIDLLFLSVCFFRVRTHTHTHAHAHAHTRTHARFET
jgi:hypothetical protein